MFAALTLALMLALPSEAQLRPPAQLDALVMPDAAGHLPLGGPLRPRPEPDAPNKPEPKPVEPKPRHPLLPDDGLLGKGKFSLETKVDLPEEAKTLMRDAHDDRWCVAAFFCWGLGLMTLFVVLYGVRTVKYLLSRGG